MILIVAVISITTMILAIVIAIIMAAVRHNKTAAQILHRPTCIASSDPIKPKT
jgi:NADH:ubiquinone oxidoreductase subunit K